MPDPRAAIGVFDSGVGGLTVFSRIAQALPHENLVYLGDTARVPYGTKSRETVVAYARACAQLLLTQDIKLLVVACNTASAYAMEALSDELPVPVIGVVEPGARAAVRATRTGRIGVIGTPATVGSLVYPRAIAALNANAYVHAQACPLFVPLAEEGWTEGEIAEAVARRYLGELLATRVDVLLLGCTHYPMLSSTISAVAGDSVTLVDSAQETANVVRELLEHEALLRPEETPGTHRFLVTDSPERFQEVGARFCGFPVDNVQWVNLNACPTNP